MKRNYDQMMRDLPLEKCPDRLNAKIIIDSGSMEWGESRPVPIAAGRIQFAAGLHLLFALLFFIVSAWIHFNLTLSPDFGRISINTVALIDQVSCFVQNIILDRSV